MAATTGFNVNQGPASADNDGNLPAILENVNIGNKPFRNLLYIEKSDPHPSRLPKKPREFQQIGTVPGKGIYQDDLQPPEPGAVIEGLPDGNDEIFTVVENRPFPAGGMKVFYSYVAKNLKYPSQARRMGIEGKVFIQFVVGKDGKLRDIEVLKGIGGGCNEENWIPGYQRGRSVNVRMVLPITFNLG